MTNQRTYDYERHTLETMLSSEFQNFRSQTRIIENVSKLLKWVYHVRFEKSKQIHKNGHICKQQCKTDLIAAQKYYCASNW